MRKLFVVNFPNDAAKFDWLRRFAAASKEEQQAMLETAAKEWPMLNGEISPNAAVN